MKHIKDMFIGTFVLALIAGVSWGLSSLITYLCSFKIGQITLSMVGILVFGFALGKLVRTSIS